MAQSYGLNDLRNGLRLLIDDAPCVVVDTELVKPGKGQAFTRIKYKNLLTGRVVERTYKASDSAQGADVMDADMQYLYNDGEYWHFMDPNSYEQCQADASVVGDAAKWLKEQDTCMVTLWNGNPILVTPPNFVVLEITHSDPGVRGDTSSGANKPATLQTGAVIRVPLFVQEGERIRIDTRTGEYVSRAKD